MSRSERPQSSLAAAPPLRARLLGEVALAVGERPVPGTAWSGRGGRSLLLLLLVSNGHQFSRDRIEGELWPDLSPSAARNASHKALHELRRMLQPDLAARDPGAYIWSNAMSIGIEAAMLDLDVTTFASLLGQARGLPDDEQFRLLKQALALYRGPLLAQEDLGDMVRARRESLHQEWTEAGGRLGEIGLRLGATDEVIDFLQPVAAASPTNERVIRGLIRAYDRDGRRDQARRWYERLAAAMRDELDLEPSIETQRLMTRMIQPDIWQRDRPSGGRLQRIHLPRPQTRLIGRDDEMQGIESILAERGARLLTFVGPGGVGKTRLALEIVHEFAEPFPDGACFVELSTVRDPRFVLTAIVQALGIRDDSRLSEFDRVIDVLRGQRFLLVLDNFEHLIEASVVCADLLAACPDLTILATSREPLRLRSERVVPIDSLAAPDADWQTDDVMEAVARRSPAVELFVERADAAQPAFSLTRSNARQLAEICQRLDGLPLAIELAAARCRDLPLAEVHQRLTRRLDLLVDGYRDLPARQQTMRQTLSWSYDLLSDGERLLFRCLAVLPGGASTDLVDHLELEADRRSVLQSLVDKSLLRWRTPDRVVMLEAAREFGIEQLVHEGEFGIVQEQIGRYFLDLASEASGHLAGADQGIWLDRLEDDYANIREVLSWMVHRADARTALHVCTNIWRYWWCRNPLSEGREWLARALALPDTGVQRERGEALHAAATLAESQGDFTQSTKLHEEALAIWRSLDSLIGQARALSGLGTVATHRGDYAVASALHQQALELAERAGDTAGVARSFDRLGTAARRQGNFARAEACYEQSLLRFRDLRDRVNVSIVLSNLGEACYEEQEFARAAELFEEALRLERDLDLPDGLAFDLTNLARVRLALGEYERAAALSAQGIRLFRDLGNQLGLAGALGVFGAVCLAVDDVERALIFIRESLDILTELDGRSWLPEHLELLARALLVTGDSERAMQALGCAESLRQALASPAPPMRAAMVRDSLREGRDAIGPGRTEAALALGRTMSPAAFLQTSAIDGARREMRPVSL